MKLVGGGLILLSAFLALVKGGTATEDHVGSVRGLKNADLDMIHAKQQADTEELRSNESILPFLQRKLGTCDGTRDPTTIPTQDCCDFVNDRSCTPQSFCIQDVGSGVSREIHPGNPACTSLGFDIGFRQDKCYGGTYDLSSWTSYAPEQMHQIQDSGCTACASINAQITITCWFLDTDNTWKVTADGDFGQAFTYQVTGDSPDAAFNKGGNIGLALYDGALNAQLHKAPPNCNNQGCNTLFPATSHLEFCFLCGSDIPACDPSPATCHPVCQECQSDACVNINEGGACADNGNCGTCTGGACVAGPNTCHPECQECQADGSCANVDGGVCTDGGCGVCSGGACTNQIPTCDDECAVCAISSGSPTCEPDNEGGACTSGSGDPTCFACSAGTCSAAGQVGDACTGSDDSIDSGCGLCGSNGDCEIQTDNSCLVDPNNGDDECAKCLATGVCTPLAADPVVPCTPNPGGGSDIGDEDCNTCDGHGLCTPLPTGTNCIPNEPMNNEDEECNVCTVDGVCEVIADYAEESCTPAGGGDEACNVCQEDGSCGNTVPDGAGGSTPIVDPCVPDANPSYDSACNVCSLGTCQTTNENGDCLPDGSSGLTSRCNECSSGDCIANPRIGDPCVPEGLSGYDLECNECASDGSGTCVPANTGDNCVPDSGLGDPECHTCGQGLCNAQTPGTPCVPEGGDEACNWCQNVAPDPCDPTITELVCLCNDSEDECQHEVSAGVFAEQQCTACECTGQDGSSGPVGVCEIQVGQECTDEEPCTGPDTCDATTGQCEGEQFCQGCTPGYWKQSQHFDSWPAQYSQEQLFVDVFGTDCGVFAGQSLLEVLGARGGKENALGRHAVAALLNANSVNYFLNPPAATNTAEVIAAVQAACSGGDVGGTKDLFESANEEGCPLN